MGDAAATWEKDARPPTRTHKQTGQCWERH